MKFSDRPGPEYSAPCRNEPSVLRTIYCVQNSHSLGLCAERLNFTHLEDILSNPLRDTGSSVDLENKMINCILQVFPLNSFQLKAVTS